MLSIDIYIFQNTHLPQIILGNDRSASDTKKDGYGLYKGGLIKQLAFPKKKPELKSNLNWTSKPGKKKREQD